MPTLPITSNVYFWTSPEGLWLATKIICGLAALGFILWGLDQLFAPISVVPFGIVGFFGKRGSGKSFGMTTYARRWCNAKRNKPVFTNMEKFVMPGRRSDEKCQCLHICVHDPTSRNYHDCTREQELDDHHSTHNHTPCRYILNGCKSVHINASFAQMEACRDGLVAIDEAGIFISNLNFADRRNRQFARWLVATRHYKVMVLLTAHTPGTINNRLRDVMDTLIEMSAFTTLKLFRGYVYDSGKAYGNAKLKSETVFIPMWWTTSRSYNTDSLRLKADQEEKDIIGEDFDLPGLGEALQARSGGSTTANVVKQTTTIGEEYADSSPPVSTLSYARRSAFGGDTNDTGAHLLRDMPLVDAATLNEWVRLTAETWNPESSGRTPKPKYKPIAKPRVRKRA